MNLKSFGCSFIFGTDLADSRDNEPPVSSRTTWPALVAKELGATHQCYARPGSGNLQVLERVLTQCANAGPNDVFVIGWTWIDRHDYIEPTNNLWADSIMLAPKTPWKTIVPVDDSELAQTYYKKLHSQYQDKLTTLIYMKTAIDMLREHNIKFVMTYIDNLTFETEWQPNAAISELQKYIWPYTTQFENETFLNWSKSKNFEISPTLHPLEAAHRLAADYIMRQVFDKKNTDDPTPPALS
jgi:hypothetical protein